jgi:hypothetical protein
VRYFFYGTLLDPDVRRLVLGSPAASGVPARLGGFRRVGVAGRSYPTLVPVPDGSVEGLVVDTITPRQRVRLVAFEGREYREIVRTVMLADGDEREARLFVSRRPARVALHWSLALWQRREKDRFLRALAGNAMPPSARGLDGQDRRWRRSVGQPGKLDGAAGRHQRAGVALTAQFAALRARREFVEAGKPRPVDD